MTSNGPSAFSLPRLVIASVSSAAAAVVVHQLWPPGTIPSAALTPVLVELFAAALRRVNPRWLEAAALGLVAFACGAAGLTAGELIVQRSVASPDQRTTLLGGSRPPHPPPRPAAPTATRPSGTDPRARIHARRTAPPVSTTPIKPTTPRQDPVTTTTTPAPPTTTTTPAPPTTTTTPGPPVTTTPPSPSTDTPGPSPDQASQPPQPAEQTGPGSS